MRQKSADRPVCVPANSDGLPDTRQDRKPGFQPSLQVSDAFSLPAYLSSAVQLNYRWWRALILIAPCTRRSEADDRVPNLVATKI
jgi:hypothetical protein